MPCCMCSCSLHDALQHSITASSGGLQHIEPLCNCSDDEQDDVEGDALALSSPRNEDDEYCDDTSVGEREEAEAAVTTLQFQVRSLRKYKANYELLCGQLGELNAQIGLQLQRHEADVVALQASIADLQTEKMALEAKVSELQHILTAQRNAAREDREYSEHVHCQLGTAAELLKATEKRLEQQEEHFTLEIERLRSQLAVDDEECEGYQATVKGLQEELGTLRERETAAKEQEALLRRREKCKHKKELMARAAKLRAVSDELEAQRSSLRASKKQLVQVQAENDALRKQLANVKRDGAHLTDIIDSQRFEHESHADELSQAKKEKKQLAKRVAVLSEDVEQLQKELVDAREELLYKNGELESCRTELKDLRNELRHTAQALDEAQRGNEKLTKQLETLQKTEKDRRTKIKKEEQQQRASRERGYHKEVLRMRELLADNQQRATESSKDVQKLRRELLGVQKLLHGCTEQCSASSEPVDQWAEVLRNSIKAEESVLKSVIMEQVRAFGA